MLKRIQLSHFRYALLEAFQAYHPQIFPAGYEPIYDNYLNHPSWQLIKRFTREEFERRCWVCHDRVNLEVHHIMYPALPFSEKVNGREIDDSDVVLLCRYHHNMLQGYIEPQYFESESELLEIHLARLHYMRNLYGDLKQSFERDYRERIKAEP